ncbi:hypothetical protein NMY22_g14240 [Coprinellus aureogranulatus]|nr:hypothetical protein NMY22_g14240 [Coprinellus aureogranulatus]
MFHASLLQMHYRNDDQLFPGCVDNQIWEYPNKETEREYPVKRILLHQGAKTDARFELLWEDGEKSWLPYHKISHLGVLKEYLKAMGGHHINELSEGNGKIQNPDEQIELGFVSTPFQNDKKFEGILIHLGVLDIPCYERLTPIMSFPANSTPNTYSSGYAHNGICCALSEIFEGGMKFFCSSSFIVGRLIQREEHHTTRP